MFWKKLAAFLSPDMGGGAASGEGNGQAAAAENGEKVAVGAEQTAEGQLSPAANSTQAPEESFEQLIKGKYKQDYDARVQKIVSERFKKAKATEERYAKLSPVLEALGAKYGIDTANLENLDFDVLSQKVQEDKALNGQEALEAEAIAKGVPVETLVKMRDLERANARLTAEKNQRLLEQRALEAFNRMRDEGNELKKLYPSFDLATELQDDRFVRLTRPDVGFSVQEAYEAIHARELQPAAMAYGVQKAAEKLSNSVQSASNRPLENGIGGRQGLVGKPSVKTWTDEDHADIARRVHMGEKIML